MNNRYLEPVQSVRPELIYGGLFAMHLIIMAYIGMNHTKYQMGKETEHEDSWGCQWTLPAKSPSHVLRYMVPMTVPSVETVTVSIRAHLEVTAHAPMKQPPVGQQLRSHKSI